MPDPKLKEAVERVDWTITCIEKSPNWQDVRENTSLAADLRLILDSLSALSSRVEEVERERERLREENPKASVLISQERAIMAAEARAEAAERERDAATNALIDFADLLADADERCVTAERRLSQAEEVIRLAKVTVSERVETERYLERKAIRAGEYTPDPNDTHKSAAAKADEAICAFLQGDQT